MPWTFSKGDLFLFTYGCQRFCSYNRLYGNLRKSGITSVPVVICVTPKTNKKRNERDLRSRNLSSDWKCAISLSECGNCSVIMKYVFELTCGNGLYIFDRKYSNTQQKIQKPLGNRNSTIYRGYTKTKSFAILT